MNTKSNWFSAHWLTLLIAAQPLLDALAFWTANESGTVAGYIRLGILLLLPLWLLVRGPERGKLLLSLGVMGLYSLLHILNCARVGYLSPVYDIAYLVRVLQMPVLAVCLAILIRDESTKAQAWRGVLIAAGLTLALLLLARATGTGRYTYPEGFGYSGWVIDDNRCAHSILLVTLSGFALCAALQSRLVWLHVAVPALLTALLLTNGTKGCYAALYGLFFGFAAFLLFEKLALRRQLKRAALLSLAALMLFAALIYPYTPRAKMSEVIAKVGMPGEIETACLEKGWDITTMSPEERFANEEVREIFIHYYYLYLGVLPDLFDRFGEERVLKHYKMTTDVERLIDVRLMERSYAAMIWEDSDLLTKLLGFEATQVGTDGIYDMENDWPALFYYYGPVGLGLYVLLLLAIVLRIPGALRRDWSGTLSEENLALLLVLGLQLGLAQFSGAILRRPNVSIYLALVLALIVFQTRREEKGAQRA